MITMENQSLVPRLGRRHHQVRPWATAPTLRGDPQRCFCKPDRPEGPISVAMDLPEVSDLELLAEARVSVGSTEGERCINELFRRHYARVASWCLRYMGDPVQAADLAQEIFAKAYRRLASFQGYSKFSTWLYSIAKNECMNAIKARSIRSIETSEESLDGLPSEDDIDSWIEREGSVQLARDLIDEVLDDTEKRVFTLHYAEDLPLQAITRLLGLQNASGAKAYLVSAKRKLSRSVLRLKAVEAREIGSGRHQ